MHQGNDDSRHLALLSLAKGIKANDSITDFRRLIDQLQLSPEHRNWFLTEAVTRTFDSISGERMRWLIDRSHPDHLHANVERAIESWSREDFNAVARWLGTLDRSDMLDTAVARFSLTIARFEPESALEWAATLNDPDLRSATEQRIRLAGEQGN